MGVVFVGSHFSEFGSMDWFRLLNIMMACVRPGRKWAFKKVEKEYETEVAVSGALFLI